MKINHNIAAIKSSNRLQVTNANMAKSIERLSSGYRINRAADDAAGMAISQKMKTQIRGLEQASRNGADGISVIQTAEGALNEVESMLQRMRELSVQAANGTNTGEDREAIQDEINQLRQEIDRISTDTEFNTKKLLNGDADRKIFTSNTKVSIVSLSDEVLSKKYQITVTGAATHALQKGNQGVNADAVAEDEAGKITINGETVEISEGMSSEELYTTLRKLGDAVNVNVYATDGAGVVDKTPVSYAAGKYLTFEAKESGSSRYVEVYCDNQKLAEKLGITNVHEAGKTYGKDAEITLLKDSTKAETFTDTATAVSNGNLVTVSDKNGFEMVVKVEEDIDATAQPTVELTILEAGPLILQVGANEDQTVTVSIPKADCDSLGISNINVNTQDGAGEAITALDKAINKVSSIRAKLGAYENRLEHAITNLDTTDENLTGALSRIEDLDMAQEMTRYTQLNVLSQAGTSMLSQANQMPQNILSLLQG